MYRRTCEKVLDCPSSWNPSNCGDENDVAIGVYPYVDNLGIVIVVMLTSVYSRERPESSEVNTHGLTLRTHCQLSLKSWNLIILN